MSKSDSYIARARSVLPGGVNSPVRAFKAVGGKPLVVADARGAYLIDVDGREFIDYVMSWGATILGHADQRVTDALKAAVERGTSYGMTSPGEIEIAELVCELMPSIEMIRFVSSGTEATMSAARVARAATGRKLILKFEGCYHGHADSFLVAAGSGVATLSLPDSPGVPTEVAELTLTCPYNDIDSVHEIFEKRGDQIAAVIVEPLVGNSGFIRPLPDFLPTLRTLTKEKGGLLIFDEVMTGFRVSLGGFQQTAGIVPDLTTLGKVIGGGMPVAAYGGRKELMEMVAPQGSVYQAGTLSGNPLTMAVGLAVLTALKDGEILVKLAKRTASLTDGLASAARNLGVPLTVDCEGAMWGLHFTSEPVRNFQDAKAGDAKLFSAFHRCALDRGVLLAPSPFEAAFVSEAHTDGVITDTIDKLADALEEAANS